MEGFCFFIVAFPCLLGRIVIGMQFGEWKGIYYMGAQTHESIRTAVVPAAGLGTRLRPLTSICPKELLPLGRKPALEIIVEELHSVGVNCIIFVVSPQKLGIREYFGDSLYDGSVALRYAVQETQCGLADAILCSESLVDSDDFIVALGDTIILSGETEGPTHRLIKSYRENGAGAAIVVDRVPWDMVSLYGIVRPVGQLDDRPFEIDALIEKPDRESAPSDYAIGGRYLFSRGIFETIRRTKPGVGGELQITDSISVAMSEGDRVWCAPMRPSERRFDIGSFKSYCEAFASVCSFDHELVMSLQKGLSIT